jgi:hypothetical protein
MEEIGVGTSMPEGQDEKRDRLRLAAEGDAGSWAALVSGSRRRLRRMVAFRLLGIKEKAAGMRYVRALRRLKQILSSLNPDWLEP